MGNNYSNLVEILKEKSYEVYEEPYKLNIVGIRKKRVKLRTKEQYHLDITKPHNIYPDELVVFFNNDSGLRSLHVYNIATAPDSYYIKDLDEDFRILPPNQYKNIWSIKEGHDLYKCICLDKEIEVLTNEKELEKGEFIVNIHKGNKHQIMANWSDICQVFKREKDFDEFMSFCYMHQFKHDNSFTYTLLEE